MLLNEFLEESASSHPDKVGLICNNRRLTFAEIDKAASNLAKNLIQLGFQKQDRAIVYLENSSESIVSIFGILKAGGIFVVINPEVKPKKLAYIIKDCQPCILVTDSKRSILISEIEPELSTINHILVTDHQRISNKVNSNIEHLSFDSMTADNLTAADLKPRCIDIDLAGLIYTSGSSGNPKGVMLTHLNMVSAAKSITQYLDNTRDDIIIDTLPLSFDYGLYQVLMAFKVGATVVLEKGFIFPEQVINLVVKEKVTGWPVVPTIAAMLCQLKNLDKHDFSNVRYITSTGQVLPPKHIAKLREIFPETKIFSMYGLTECKRVSYLPPDQLEKKPGSVGKAMPNTEVYLVDENSTEIMEAEKPGELVVRGSNVMKGYWNLPEETNRALRPGKYPGEMVLYSGDLFKKDEDGYLYFLGRKDDIIKTSGHMVSPKEIESILCEMEGVIEAAVIGVDDEVLGRAVKAFVHLTESSKATEKEVISFCYKHLESYAVPKYISFCGLLPKTESGKIQKRDLA